MEEGFLFHADQEKQASDLEKERRSLIYGTPEFRLAYAEYIKSPQWRKLCKQVRARAKNRCENCQPGTVAIGKLTVHHIKYDRFMHEHLSDLKLLCVPCHLAADHAREKANRENYEAAGEEAREQAWRTAFFRTKYGEEWMRDYAADPEGMETDFDEWRQRKAEEEDYDNY